MQATMAEIKKKGWKALVKELGPADATKFILQYEPGKGDYTKERKKLFKNVNLKKIQNAIKSRRRHTTSS